MKVAIRRGVFETNSSSTHSITIVAKEEFEKWRDGETLFDKYEQAFVPKATGDEKHEYEYKDDLETYEDYFYGGLESFHTSHVTKSKDEIVAFGTYGYDG